MKAYVGRNPGQVISHVVVLWRTHRGGLVSRVLGERSESPILTLNLCVRRRYYLGEGDLVSTLTFSLLLHHKSSLGRGLSVSYFSRISVACVCMCVCVFFCRFSLGRFLIG